MRFGAYKLHLREEAMSEVVTISAIRKAARACEQCSEARKLLEEMDSAKTIAMMEIFEPLLGIKTEDELKVIPLDALRRIASRRITQGIVSLEGITAEMLLQQAIQLSQTRRNVSWKDSFLDELGEAKAREVLSACPESFSYRIVAPMPTPKQTLGTRVLQKR
jgi:hypothetical protein